MLRITGNIVSTTVHPDRVAGRIAAGGRSTAEPLFLSFNTFGQFARAAMSTLKKGQYVTLEGMPITLPGKQRPGRQPERNTILKVESLIKHADAGGSAVGRTSHVLFGRLGVTPSVNPVITSGEGAFSAANLSVAENVTYVQRQTGEVVERTQWHNVSVYGAPNHNPASGLAAGDPVLVRGRIESDKYTSLSGVRVGAVKTVAAELVCGEQHHQSVELIGVADDVEYDHARNIATMSLMINPLRQDPFRVPLIVHGRRATDITNGRYLLAAGIIESAPKKSRRVRAEYTDVTLLDTPAAPGGTGVGKTDLTIIGSLAEKPEARLTESGGQPIAVADATLVISDNKSPLTIDVSIWRNAAEIVSEYAEKGDRILMRGSLGPDSERALSARVNYVRMI